MPTPAKEPCPTGRRTFFSRHDALLVGPQRTERNPISRLAASRGQRAERCTTCGHWHRILSDDEQARADAAGVVDPG